MHSQPPESLAVAYSRALYQVEAVEGRFTLRIGEFCAELQSWHERMGVNRSAFLSAANPLSEPTDAWRNTAAHERLLERLAAAGFRTAPGRGEDPMGLWIPERSVLVAGITTVEALRLAADFNQYAIAYAEPDAVPRLCWTWALSVGLS